MAPGFLLIIILCIILGLVLLTGLISLAVAITKNRDDDTPLWEPIILSFLLTPIIVIMLEMLKPYKPNYESESMRRVKDDSPLEDKDGEL